MATLTTLRQQLNTIIEAAAREIEQREQAIAAASEQLSQDQAVQAAWRQGAASKQGQIVAMIDHMRAELHRGGVNATCLDTLRRQILETQQ
jgi:vacuolar-type H+-ATPase subunit I/STV1